jgi:hypothetical protein
MSEDCIAKITIPQKIQANSLFTKFTFQQSLTDFAGSDRRQPVLYFLYRASYTLRGNSQ